MENSPHLFISLLTNNTHYDIIMHNISLHNYIDSYLSKLLLLHFIRCIISCVPYMTYNIIFVAGLELLSLQLVGFNVDFNNLYRLQCIFLHTTIYLSSIIPLPFIMPLFKLLTTNSYGLFHYK